VAVVAEASSIAPLIALLDEAGLLPRPPGYRYRSGSLCGCAVAPEVDFLMSSIVGVAAWSDL